MNLNRVFSFFQAFWKSLFQATLNYLWGKVRHRPPVTPKGRREMIHLILEEKNVQVELQKFSQESGIPLDQVEETFRGYLFEIAADLTYLSYPFWDFLLTWSFDTIYEGVEVDTTSLERLRILSGTRPLVFVSNHRSHTDYLILNYLLYRHRIPMPHVCGGANLSFWPLGPLFRKGGCFFIRRSFDGNKLYTAAVNAYIEQLLRQGCNLEFFIEGGRSRTGKLLPPRLGILSAVIRAWENGAQDDILLVPVTITYESILEEKSYSAEQAGASKRPEGFRDLFRIQKYLTMKKGKVYLKFSEPIALSSFGVSKLKPREIASDLTYGINRSTVVTASSLVALSLLTEDRRSISGNKIEEKIDLYLEYLATKEAPLSEPLQKFRRNAIREALRNYRKNHLIEELSDNEGTLYRIPQERRPLLDYYKNNSLHFFVSLAVLATILLRLASSNPVPFETIDEEYGFLKILFQYEFTFSQRQPLRSHLEKLLTFLGEKGIVRSDAKTIELLEDERLSFYAAPLTNFFESYSILLKSFSLMHEERWESNGLLNFLLRRGEILYWKEEVRHAEAKSRFTLMNAVWAFRDLGLLSEEKEGFGKKKKVFYKINGTMESYRPLEKKITSYVTSDVYSQRSHRCG